ncbi:MAG: zinc-binding dehydrogenase [Phycisphaerales bacterium]|nr:zinc-binding dehydrogenase [Phycisphaerales bacterium]
MGLPDSIAVLAEPFAVGVHVCERARLTPGGRSLVIGAGPIGLIVAMVAKVCGQRVTLSEISDQRITQAREFGFTVIDGRNDAPVAAKAASDGDGFDTVFEVSGSAPGLSLALEAARVQGTVVQVGFFSKHPTAEFIKAVLKELTLVGSRVYTQEDFRRAVGLLTQLASTHQADLERLISGRVGLHGIAGAIASTLAGEVTGKY